MIEQHQRDLIQAAVDGELDASERAELDALLAASDEAREFYADLRAIDDLLDSVPDVTPPGGLRQSMMDRIRLPDQTGKQSLFRQDATLTTSGPAAGPEPDVKGTWFPMASRYALARYAVAFVAGLLITVAGYEYASMGASGDQTSDLVGSLVSSMITTGEVPDAAARNSEVLDLEQLTGEISLHRNRGLYILELDLESTDTIELTMDLAGNNLELDGYAELDSDLESVQVVHDVLRVTHIGKNRFAVLLRTVGSVTPDAPGNVLIKFYTGGRQVHESVLAIPR